ncbi:MAG: SGNH/GDSL hydrolase family protein [Candidatus Hodarchaeota archaeon]
MSKTIKLLCIGNSHTAGYPFFDPMYGGNPESSYEYWLNLRLTKTYPNLAFTLENQGICGQESSEVFTRLKTLFNTKEYEIVIYWAGANDIAIGYSIESIWQNLWKAYRLVEDKKAGFILVTIPPMDWYEIDQIILKLNEMIISNSKDTYICANVYPELEDNSRLKKDYDIGDGVHLSVDGYQMVGKVIFNAISRYLTSKAI